MSRAGLPWFDTTLRDIERRIREERLPHAVLAVIPEGWGKTLFLEELTIAFLGLENLTGQLRDLPHPDFQWVQSRDKDGDWIDAIQIDAIRSLGEFATQRAMRSARKLAILPAAHNMNANAANALLKSLEEPASACCFVIETSSPAQLPSTILSRCQRLDLRFPRSAAIKWLEAQGRHDAVALLGLVGGGPMDALDVLRDGENNIRLILNRLEDRNSRQGELDRLAQSGRLHAILGQWYRLLPERLAATHVANARQSLIRFGDELAQCRYQIGSVRGANVRLLLDRLAFLWDTTRSA